MWHKSYTPIEIKKLSFAANGSGVIVSWARIRGIDLMAKQPFLGVLCLTMLLSTSSWAATIEPGQGSLTINQGQGFQPINSRVDANVGDSVMVAPGGSATLVYDDGCKVDVQPDAVTTIAPISPCASGSYAQDGSNWTGALIMGAAAGAAIGFGAYEASQSPSGNGAPASP
jgi:hypothetical protein